MSLLYLIFTVLSDDGRVQGGDSRKYCRVPIDDTHHVENAFEFLRDAVNFICEMAINLK